jgi:hypothetical protein
MSTAFLALTLLCAHLFSIGPYVADLLDRAVRQHYAFEGSSPLVLQAVWLFWVYAPAAIAVALFFHYARLKQRVSLPPAGQGWMLAGVVLTLFYAAIRLLAWLFGPLPSYLVVEYSSFVLWPARICLVLGVVTVYSCARVAGCAQNLVRTCRNRN